MKIRNVSPPRFSTDLISGDMKDGVKRCLHLMKSFYKDSSFITNTKLWNDLRSALLSVPNVFVFQTILRQLETCNNGLEQLGSSAITEDKIASSIYQQLTPKLCQLEIISGVEMFSLKSKLKNIKLICSEQVHDVTNDLEGVMNSSVEDSYICDEDVVGDFLSAMLERLVMQGKYLQTVGTITKLKRESKEKEVAMKTFMTTINDIQAIHNAVKDRILDAQHKVAEMFQINLKLNFGKISMAHLVLEAKQQGMSRMMNLTTWNEDVIPSHRIEQQAFLNTLDFMNKFDITSNILICELNNNQLITDDENGALLIECRGCDVSSLNKLLDSMMANFESYQKFNPILVKKAVKLDRPTEVSISDLNKNLSANRESVAQLLDLICQLNVGTKSLLREFNLLYEYSLQNPFKKYIPTSIKIDNKSFKLYENDFNLYYRMIKD